MSLSEILKKFSSRWWIILITFVFFTAAFYPQTVRTQYRGVATYGVNLTKEISPDAKLQENSDTVAEDVKKESTPETDIIYVDPAEKFGDTLTLEDRTRYFDSLERFTLFLRNKITSSKVQFEVAKSAEIPTQNFSESKAFYTVDSEGLGYIEVIYSSGDKEEVEKVFEELNKQFDQIIIDWNKVRQEEVRIYGVREQSPIIIEQTASMQTRILPSVSGLIFGLALILLWPLSKVED